ncbi:hypothetical protein [Streptomyces sp. MST-110588]|uniref:hypothetical protein n=1 Tax=Streptomyces sp. MST-110588 TaxID=2833628 RepID=UPI001F5D17E8|nr:hypothetical protein [Streptomyces sp. MST-110588]UNO42952.1 hypothetical protein KGS77_29885 [Streptomyces sp. MST-110588]
MNFTDLAGDLRHPAVDAFLTAVDASMNSTTLLLKFAVDIPVTAQNRHRVLHAFLRDDLFEEMMVAADRVRDWYNLSDHFDEGVCERPLLRAGFRAAVSPLSRTEFVARLGWMLCEAFSPYRRHYTKSDAEKLVRDVTHQLLGQDDCPWLFASVEPDFLRSSGYFSGEEALRPVYFDGSDSDTATFIHGGHVCYLLLTNGSP